ncbi:putative D,D-dipeptide ABC transporter membrane subunit DdpC [Hyphomicrobiales bacterium]|nr:putative D,D-dipeptide ABC transporter membrane subunit DdpC [Hyphomicrobiales bacterium]
MTDAPLEAMTSGPDGPTRRRRLPTILRQPLTVLAAAILLLIVSVALVAPWLDLASPTRMSISQRLRPPSAAHWLGTDEFGRDVFARIVYGARTSLLVGFLIVLVACVVGTTIGLMAGYVRRADGILMRFTDALMAFPDILLAIALLAGLGPSLFNVVIALAIVYTPRVARVIRGATLVLREMPFIEAADSFGASRAGIILRHLLPNVASPLLVQATFIFAYSVLTEAALSFLGAGVPPTTPTWGNMIAAAQQYMQQAGWLILAPGITIIVTVVALQVLGDGLRDALDPKLRRLV